MISMVTDLVIRLVKERESNKQLVLKECLTPLKAHIDQLHKHYLTELNRLKGSLSDGTSQKDMERRVMVAFDEAVFKRTVIANQLRAMLKVTNARLDRYGLQAHAFAQAVVTYLEGSMQDERYGRCPSRKQSKPGVRRAALFKCPHSWDVRRVSADSTGRLARSRQIGSCE